MKIFLFPFLIVIVFLNGCKGKSLPDRNLSRANIELVELTFPKANGENKSITLDSSHLELFAEILKNRKEEFVNPNNCYTLHIQLKDGGSLNYITVGINFQGFDDSFDLPFSFKTQTDNFKEIFNLQKIDSCK